MSNFFVEPTILKLRDTEVKVSPLCVKNISKAAKAAAPLVDALSGGVISPLVVIEQADSVIEVCALATDQSIDFIGNLNAAEMLVLLTAVVQVNSDFFIQAIAPQMKAMMGTIQTIAANVQKQSDGKKA